MYVRALDAFADLRALDGFCGAGGSSEGLKHFFRVVWAANHWNKAVKVHELNHPNTDHETADLRQYNWRALPRKIHLAWFSPSCTHHSPAGGNKAEPGQDSLFTDMQEDDRPLEEDAAERSRMTMMDVIAAVEVHHFPVVIVENVIEATRWRKFHWWLQGMINEGYQYRPLCVNSGHVWNGDEPGPPQFRDRWYGIFVRNDLPMPDLEPYPLAWCPTCEEDVRAVQSWRNPKGSLVGKYKQTIPWKAGYDYRCPDCPTVVEPYVRPAFTGIDWTNPGQLMGPKLHTFHQNTLIKVQDGLNRLHGEPFTALLRHGLKSMNQTRSVGQAPFSTRTTKTGDALVTPPGFEASRPFMISVTHGLEAMARTRYADEAPFPTRTTRIGDALVIPNGPQALKQMKIMAEPFLAILRNNGPTFGVSTEPFRTVATARHHALVIPPVTSRRLNGIPVVQPAELAECSFRMTTWRESLNAQGFGPYNMGLDDPALKIGVTNATAMAGNAVSTNVARWLASIFAEHLTANLKSLQRAA